jgi:hypothetical protein
VFDTEAAPARIDAFGTVPIIATHDTELRLVPTMGSVVQMRLIRTILFAIVVAIALAGGADATASATVAQTSHSLVAEAHPCGGATTDPSDPGLPPD